MTKGGYGNVLQFPVRARRPASDKSEISKAAFVVLAMCGGDWDLAIARASDLRMSSLNRHFAAAVHTELLRMREDCEPTPAGKP